MKISRNAKIIYGIIAVLFVVMFLLYKVSLNVWGVYTVGEISRISTARGTKVSYVFYYDGKQYEGMITEPMNHNNVGKHYFVKFLKPAPVINLLLPERSAQNCQAFNNQVLNRLPDCK